MRCAFFIPYLLGLTTGLAYEPIRFELVPQPNHQVAFLNQGQEVLRWHFGAEYPRPFFYPLTGPSGQSLTRMGHPGAQNHDHHRSVWFAHHSVNGQSYWDDRSRARIRQKHWLAYRDGQDESIMACRLGWFDDQSTEVMEQDVVAALSVDSHGHRLLELQLTFKVPENRELVEIGKTNFGFMGIRVAKSLSHHFGGGQISNSEGQIGEKAIFGKQARWMDYSGPVTVGAGEQRKAITEGITWFDHPGNPRYPTRWHVRSDGWMGASFCMKEGWELTKEKPLVLRYLIVTHRGEYDSDSAEKYAKDFAAKHGFSIGKRGTPHRQFEVWRKLPQETQE